MRGGMDLSKSNPIAFKICFLWRTEDQQTDISPASEKLVFVYFAGDGACFCWSAKLLRHGGSEEVTSWELIGPDYDPVYSICRSANTVHSACRDKTIRKYILKKSELPT